jgi:hypothetical protein
LLAAAESVKTASFGVGVLCAGVVVGIAGPQLTYVAVGLGVLLGCLPLGIALVRQRDPALQQPQLATA